MNRHAFQWQGLFFGTLFLAAAGSWAVWEQDLLTPRQFSFVTSGVLILIGVAGVVATVWKSHTRTSTSIQSEEDTHETPDTQS